MSRRVRIASVNVNGIRAAARKGMLGWLEEADVDILALQEVRASEAELRAALPGWDFVNDEALAKGYAGVAIAGRVPPVEVRKVLGDETLDTTGRWIEADCEVDGERFTVVSAYVPSGEVGTARQDAKWAFLDAMEERMPLLEAHAPLAVIMGDLNVGHREFDIRNWKGNVKKAGFLPRERAYFDRFVGSAGSSVTGARRVDRNRTRLGRCGAAVPRRDRRAVHLVVEPRQGVRQRHRLAHRLPPGHAGPRRAGRRLPRRAGALLGHAVERPRARRRGLHARPLSA